MAAVEVADGAGSCSRYICSRNCQRFEGGAPAFIERLECWRAGDIPRAQREDVASDNSIRRSLCPVSRLALLQPLLAGKRRAIGSLSLASVLGGFAEALFLVTVTRTGFAITDGADQVEYVAGRSLSIGQSIALAFALVLARIALAVGATWQRARLSTAVIVEQRRQLAGAYLRSTWSAQHGERAGRLQELLTTFSQRGANLVNALMQGITNGFSLLALLVSAIVLDPVASMVVILAVAVLSLSLRPLRAAVRRQARLNADTGMNYATALSEISQLGMEMHVFGVQRQTERRVSSVLEENAKSGRRLSFLSGLVPAVYTGLAYLALVAGLAVVAAIDAADLTAVSAVMLVMLRSLSYGQSLQTSSATIQSSLPFLESLDSELARYKEARAADGGVPIGSLGPIEMEDVSFAYTADVPVLRSISLRIEPTEVVGVVGPSGSGKSTLVQLLLALRPPSSGRVLAGGRDVKDLSTREWVRKVTFVPQQAHLIAGTVADNIRFMRDDVSQEQIEAAARAANLHADVIGFAEGYERQAGERGSHLSGGQQQRLIIARALVEDPELLILDEPTSSLDVRSEQLIRETLNELRSRMTIIIIAHRLSTLEICDRIMVIQDGELKGFDTPQRLEVSSDFYREALLLSGLR